MSETNGTIVKKSPTSVSVGNRGLQAGNFDELWRIAEMVSQSGFAPRGMKDNPVDCMTAMAHGLEVGLSPMQAVQNIAVINGRPSIWGDAMVGLVLGSGLMVDQSLAFEGQPHKDDYTAVYTCQRKGFTTASESRYSVADAKRANLWGKKGPWSDYPDRMLGIRARAFGLRNTFADVLGGLYMAEEFGVTRDSFDPDQMQHKSTPSLEQAVGGNDTQPSNEPDLELIDEEPEEPERDPDTGEVIPEHVGGEVLFEPDKEGRIT